MTNSKISRIQTLHNAVVHSRDYTDEQMYRESREIQDIKSDFLLNRICGKCFPIVDKPKIKFPVRSAEQYSITYPKIHEVVDAEEWNSRLAKK